MADKIISTTRPETGKDHPPAPRDRMVRAGANILLVAACGAVVLYAWQSVHALFTLHLGADSVSSALAGAVSVGLLVALLSVSYASQSPAIRGLATLWSVAWFVVVLALTAAKIVLDAAAIGDAGIGAVAAQITDLAPWLAQAGNLIAGVLAALALAPLATLVGAAKNPPGAFRDENSARAHYLWNTWKLTGAGASIGLAILFGTSALGINPLVALLLGLILDTGFIVAVQQSEAAAKAGDHEHARVWSLFVFAYGVCVGLVALETVPALARIFGTPIEIPGVTDAPAIHWLGRMAYVGAVSMAVLTIILVSTARTRQLARQDGWSPAPPRIARLPLGIVFGARTSPPAVKLQPGDPANLLKETVRTCAQCGRQMRGRGRARYCSARCKRRAEYARRRGGAQ